MNIPIILCCGVNGRGAVFGWVSQLPEPGCPVTLTNARMILRWRSGGGLFGVATQGPREGSTLTCSVARVVETSWQEYLTVSDKAATALHAWPAA